MSEFNVMGAKVDQLNLEEIAGLYAKELHVNVKDEGHYPLPVNKENITREAIKEIGGIIEGEVKKTHIVDYCRLFSEIIIFKVEGSKEGSIDKFIWKLIAYVLYDDKEKYMFLAVINDENYQFIKDKVKEKIGKESFQEKTIEINSYPEKSTFDDKLESGIKELKTFKYILKDA